MQKIYRPADVCELFNISKSTLLRWEREGLVPNPERNQLGERQYTRQQVDYIAKFFHSRQYKKRLKRLLNRDSTNAYRMIQEFSEENALFKLGYLRDMSGLMELYELIPLQNSTVHSLVKIAANHYDPTDETFWEIVELVSAHQSFESG